MELHTLLSAAWIGATSLCIVAALPLKTLEPLQSVVLSFVRRGKLSPSTRFTVPQSFFVHFYVVAVIWNTFLLVVALLSSCSCTLSSTSQSTQFSALVGQFAGASGSSAGSSSLPLMAKHTQGGWTTVFLLLLMELQVCRRLYESTTMFSYSPNARMHIMAYLVGLFYYVAAPLSLCCRDLQEMVVNVVGLLSPGRSKSFCAWDLDSYWWGCFQYLGTLKWIQYAGGLIFLWGWFHQYKCHSILASLRSEPRETEYEIPYGDWFEKVSCAHYTAEIVMYVGLVLASGGRYLLVWYLLGWVVSNLYLVAKETHAWYLSTFENYPRNRRPLIPSLWP